MHLFACVLLRVRVLARACVRLCACVCVCVCALVRVCFVGVFFVRGRLPVVMRMLATLNYTCVDVVQNHRIKLVLLLERF